MSPAIAGEESGKYPSKVPLSAIKVTRECIARRLMLGWLLGIVHTIRGDIVSRVRFQLRHLILRLIKVVESNTLPYATCAGVNSKRVDHCA